MRAPMLLIVYLLKTVFERSATRKKGGRKPERKMEGRKRGVRPGRKPEI
jgi:hypothetical protein